MNALFATRYFSNLLGQVIQDETFLDFSQLENIPGFFTTREEI